mmetsp:Transcript_7517/g.7056  ORF Transcript_7517/g.7056 Transcript_7517/m.7056 type:complete len:175 (+) Transcript_7517:467-991(+)
MRNNLDLDEILDVPIKSLKDVISQYIRKKLYDRIPDIFVKIQLERIKCNQLFMKRQADVGKSYKLNDRRQIQIDDNLFLHIKKQMKEIKSSSIFGEEEVLKGGRVHRSSMFSKSPSWVISIKRDLFSLKFKEYVKRVKESKAVFIYNWLVSIDPKIEYERVKDFLLAKFKEVQY